MVGFPGFRGKAAPGCYKKRHQEKDLCAGMNGKSELAVKSGEVPDVRRHNRQIWKIFFILSDRYNQCGVADAGSPAQELIELRGVCIQFYFRQHWCFRQQRV